MGYPSSNGRKANPTLRSQDERVGGLLGDRGRSDPDLRAITRGDAAAAGEIALQAQVISAAPTAAQYNALVADVKALAAVLNQLGARFTGL